MPITPRRRRIRSTRIQDSDVEMDEPPQNNEDEEGDEGLNVDVDGMTGEPEVDAAEADSGDDDIEDEEEDDEGEDEDEDQDIPSDVEESPEKPPILHPIQSTSRLKIKIKMPGHPPSSRFDTPNVESEDDISSDDAELHSRSTRPMTTRQAVLASVMDSSHVSLNETRQKKPPLNETELALRREETARKRRNLTEKKLEDEKARH
jgi:Ino eighty subunit 2